MKVMTDQVICEKKVFTEEKEKVQKMWVKSKL